jgi:hypothetical protein
MAGNHSNRSNHSDKWNAPSVAPHCSAQPLLARRNFGRHHLAGQYFRASGSSVWGSKVISQQKLTSRGAVARTGGVLAAARQTLVRAFDRASARASRGDRRFNRAMSLKGMSGVVRSGELLVSGRFHR